MQFYEVRVIRQQMAKVIEQTVGLPRGQLRLESGKSNRLLPTLAASVFIMTEAEVIASCKSVGTGRCSLAAQIS